MKCMYCKGTMKRQTAPFQVGRKKWRMTLEAVPAWVCSQCGDVYFEEHEVAQIQDVIRTVDAHTEDMSG